MRARGHAELDYLISPTRIRAGFGGNAAYLQKFEESQRLPDVCYEGFARSLGLNGVAVDQPGQVGPA